MTDVGEQSGSGSSTPAGWYPDPGGGAQQRYWDGASWTDHYAPGSQQSAQAPATSTQAPATSTQAPAATPAPGVAPPKQGMSGCLKAFLVALFIMFIGAAVLVVSLIYIGGRVVKGVKNFGTTVAGTPGRSSSMPSGASDYTGERKQDHVAGSDGNASIGSISATATNWSRTAATGTNMICGDVKIHRSTVNSNDPFDATLQLVGDTLWELQPPSGPSVTIDQQSSSLSALSDYLTTKQTGDASGKVCFPDPGGSGQYAVTWQPRVFNSQRVVWLVKLP